MLNIESSLTYNVFVLGFFLCRLTGVQRFSLPPSCSPGEQPMGNLLHCG